MDYFDGFRLKEHRKGNGRPRNQIGRKTLLDLDYADDLNILDESVSKMDKILEVSRIRSARIGLKINAKKTKSLRPEKSECEKVTLGNEKFDLVDSLSYLGSIGSIISKEGGSRDVKIRIVRALGIRILDGTVTTLMKYGSEAWVL